MKNQQECALKICAYYNLDIEIMINGRSALNPKAEMLRDKIVKFVSDERLEEFYKKVIHNFMFFPSAGELDKMLLHLDNFRNKSSRIEFDDKLTEQKAIENFIVNNEDIRNEVDENYTVDDVLKSNRDGMSSREQLVKYGIKLCRIVWIKETENWSDEDWQQWDIENKKRAGCFEVNKTIDMRGMEYIHD
jgi:hypothetical protein